MMNNVILASFQTYAKIFLLLGKYNARDFPGAALFCLPFNPEKPKVRSLFIVCVYWNVILVVILCAESILHSETQNATDVFGEYHNMLKEIAASLHLSRNTVLALLSLRSWKTFMQCWLKNYVLNLDLKGSLTMLDKTSKAANDILKVGCWFYSLLSSIIPLRLLRALH